MNYSDNEYIKLNRKTLNWKWFDDVNTAHFFIYCLLSANWKDGYFKGEEVKRGQFVRTLKNMSDESGLTVQNIRTAIKHLKSTGELTTSLTKGQQGKTHVITVVKYDEYQSANKESNSETNSRPTTDQQQTNNRLTQIEENIRSKEEQEVKNNNPPLSPLGDGESEKPKKNTDSLPPKEAQEKINEIIDNSELSTPVKEKLKEFVEYKRSEIKKPYKSPKRFCSVELKNTIECEKKNGTDATVNCIDDCMGHGYQGLFFNNAYRYAKEKPKQQAFNAAEFLKRYEE